MTSGIACIPPYPETFCRGYEPGTKCAREFVRDAIQTSINHHDSFDSDQEYCNGAMEDRLTWGLTMGGKAEMDSCEEKASRCTL